MTGRNRADSADEKPCKLWGSEQAEHLRYPYDIFEGTEQIQQLVIARAISGLRIE